MLTPARRLSPSDLDAVDALQVRVVATDGGRLKLERGTLERRRGDLVEDLLWWEDGRLLGFLGLYAFGGPEVELAGAVDPSVRRRGVGTALLRAALPLLAARGRERALLVVPRTTGAGEAFARAAGAVLEHSEHALVLHGPPAPGPTDPALVLRTAGPDDGPAVRALLAGAGWSGEVDPDPTGARTLLGERDGRVVLTLRVSRDGDTGAVHGFVVDPVLRGRGLGRDALRRACSELVAQGCARVGLEVAVDDARALALYRSVGFAPLTTEDYWSVPARAQTT